MTDETERRVLDEVVTRFSLPPGPEADRVASKSFLFATRMLAERLRELGRAVAQAVCPSLCPSNEADGPHRSG